MDVTAAAAPYFLPFVVPICIWVAFSDMKLMKIPNVAVLALVAVYLIVGPFALPLDEYLWRILNGLVVLAIGFVANMARALGAGDAKFAAAAAPFFAASEATNVVIFFAVVMLAAFFTHRLARRTPAIRGLVPDWKSWEAAKFPMGLALATTLAGYLAVLVWAS